MPALPFASDVDRLTAPAAGMERRRSRGPRIFRLLALSALISTLGFAAVLPKHRGLGAGRLLGEAVLAWADEQGYPAVATDWRMTNLLSSRTWPRLGFRPTFYRLHRAIA